MDVTARRRPLRIIAYLSDSVKSVEKKCRKSRIDTAGLSGLYKVERKAFIVAMKALLSAHPRPEGRGWNARFRDYPLKASKYF